MHIPHTTTRSGARAIAAAAIGALALLAAACESDPDAFVTPTGLSAPAYNPDLPGDRVLWAIAPLRNESGVSLVDSLALTDSLIYQVQQVSGVDVVPLNRTIQGMRALEMPEVSGPDEALALAQALGADAIVVGSVTAWDPYDPPKIGMALALFVEPGSTMSATPRLSDDGPPDPFLLQTAASDGIVGGDAWAGRPGSTAAAYLDSANHAVQMNLKAYAQGRSETVSALGWRRYLASMRLYAEFACYSLTEQLLDAERQRIARRSPEPSRRPRVANQDSARP